MTVVSIDGFKHFMSKLKTKIENTVATWQPLISGNGNFYMGKNSKLNLGGEANEVYVLTKSVYATGGKYNLSQIVSYAGRAGTYETGSTPTGIPPFCLNIHSYSENDTCTISAYVGGYFVIVLGSYFYTIAEMADVVKISAGKTYSYTVPYAVSTLLIYARGDT